ncbi:hypothetical protein C2S52_018133 [Perilla frutescens var. hirtella]|nr:hypothetical protein C2S52_018133 [Perilla frutescens var. hirtella]
MDSNNDEMDGNNDEMDSNSSGMDKKRKKSGQESPIPTIQNDGGDNHDVVDNDDFLTLSLASPNQPTTVNATPPPQPPPPPPPPPQHLPFINPTRITVPASDTSIPPQQSLPFINQPRISVPPPDTTAAPPFRQRRGRRNPSKTPPTGKSATIPPPYPWADAGRAAVRSLSYLRENQISRISGEVQCKKCEQKFKMELDLEQKFLEVSTFIAENKALMHHRAPKGWMSPALPKCGLCNQENTLRPVIAEKKRSINWLFLLLGQMLGCCTLDQLKYFCKHTKNHRTGAKDRVLFLAYLGLCRQLDPNGPFDI